MTTYNSLIEKLTKESANFKDLLSGSIDKVPEWVGAQYGKEAIATRGDILGLLSVEIDKTFQRDVKATLITNQLIKRTINTNSPSLKMRKRHGVIARTVDELEAFPVDFTEHEFMHVNTYKTGLGTEISRETIKDGDFDVVQMQMADTLEAVKNKIDFDTLRCIQGAAPGGDNNPTWGSYTPGGNSTSIYHPDVDYYGLNQASYTDSHIVDAGQNLQLKHFLTGRKFLKRHGYDPNVAIVHPYQSAEIAELEDFKGLHELAYVSTPNILNEMIAAGYVGSLYNIKILEAESVMPGLITMLDTSRAAIYLQREPIQMEREYVMKQQFERAQIFQRGAPAVIDGDAIAQIYNCKIS